MLQRIDYTLIGLYFLGLVLLGIKTARRVKQGDASEDYMLAGRTVTLPAFVATLVATWYGGILGVGEMAYNMGLSTWTVLGLPYYAFAIIYALFLAKRVRSTQFMTIPDTLNGAYGKAAAVLGSVLVFLLVNPAPYVLMTGQLIKDLFDWALLPAIITGTIISVIFVITGGFNNDIRTNVFQFLLMFLSFGLAVAFAMYRFGGLSSLASHLPATLKSPTGGQNIGFIVVWYFIALWTLVDPGFHQRCSAAKDWRVAQRGILISVICWAVFDFMTVTTALYARAFLPAIKEPVNTYPIFAQMVLPPGIRGIFWIGMMATVMSTVLSYTLIAAITLGRDIVWRMSPEMHAGRDVFWTRISVVLTSVIAIVVAYKTPSVVGLWYEIGTAFIPGLLIPLLTSYDRRLRANRHWTLAAMIAGSISPIALMIYGAIRGGLDTDHYLYHMEPIFFGLGLSLVIWLVGRLFFTQTVVEDMPQEELQIAHSGQDIPS